MPGLFDTVVDANVHQTLRRESQLLVQLGCPSADVRVERFGPSG